MPHRDVTKVSIPFTRGLAQAVDPQLAPQGTFVRAENLRYDKDGQVRVRHAYTALNSLGANGRDIGPTMRMFEHRGTLMRCSRQGYIQANSDGSNPSSTGTSRIGRLKEYRPGRLERTHVVRSYSDVAAAAIDPTEVTPPQIATVNGWAVVAWVQAGEVHAAVYQLNSRLEGFSTFTGAEQDWQLVVPATQISGSGDTCSNMNVVAIDSSTPTIGVTWAVTADTNIEYAYITATTGASVLSGFTSPGTLATDTGSNGIHDVAPWGDAGSEGLLLAYHRNNSSTPALRVRYYGGGFGGIVTNTYDVDDALDNGFNVALATAQGIDEIFVFYDNGTNLVCRMFTDENLALDADFPVNLTTTPAGSNPDGRLAGCVYTYGTNPGTTRACVLWQDDTGTVTSQYGTVKIATVDVDGTVSTPLTYYGVLMASRPFVVQSITSGDQLSSHVAAFFTHDNILDTNGGYSYLVLAQLTNISTAASPSGDLAILTAFARPISAIFRGAVGGGASLQQWAGPRTGATNIPRVVDSSVSGYTERRFLSVHGYVSTRRLTTGAATAIDEVRHMACAWDLSDNGLTAWSHMPARVGDSIALSGGLTTLWDGRVIRETLLNPPNITSVSASASSSGGSMASGSYQYTFAWEYLDDDGRRHQSEMSTPITVTHATGSTNKVSFEIPPLRHTWISGLGDYDHPIYAVAYRTAVGPGSIFYRCDAGSGWFVNAASGAGTGQWEDTAADATITGNEVAYTSQSIVQHEPLPASQHVITHAGRLCGVSSEDRQRIWFTAPMEELEGPVFNATFQLRVEEYGPIVALASMDGKLYALTESAIVLAAYGDGPDKTGGGGIFPSPTLLTTEAGCSDPRSVIVCHAGIYFAGSGDGGTQLYCWQHGDAGDAALMRIGDPVRDELSDMPIVTSAVHVQEQSEIRFTVNSVNFETSAILVYAYTAQRDDGQMGVWFVHTGDGSGYESAGTWRGRYCYAASADDYIENTAATTSQDFTLETGDIWLTGMHGHTRVKATTVLGTNGPAVQNIDLTLAKSVDHGQTYGDTRTFTVAGNTSDGTPFHKRRQHRRQRTTDGSVRYRITGSNDSAGAYDVVLNGITIEHLPEPGGPRLGSSDRG